MSPAQLRLQPLQQLLQPKTPAQSLAAAQHALLAIKISCITSNSHAGPVCDDAAYGGHMLHARQAASHVQPSTPEPLAPLCARAKAAYNDCGLKRRHTTHAQQFMTATSQHRTASTSMRPRCMQPQATAKQPAHDAQQRPVIVMRSRHCRGAAIAQAEAHASA